MSIKRYETKSRQIKRKLIGFDYSRDDQKYRYMCTFDYFISESGQISACLGFSESGYCNLMNEYETYANKVYEMFLSLGMCINFDDIDFYLISYDCDEISKITIIDGQVENWHGENTLFYM